MFLNLVTELDDVMFLISRSGHGHGLIKLLWHAVQSSTHTTPILLRLIEINTSCWFAELLTFNTALPLIITNIIAPHKAIVWSRSDQYYYGG